MAFNFEKFFDDIFKPQPGEVVTVMYDLPHGEIPDRPAWQERRSMAEEWRQKGNMIVKYNPENPYELKKGIAFIFILIPVILGIVFIGCAILLKKLALK